MDKYNEVENFVSGVYNGTKDLFQGLKTAKERDAEEKAFYENWEKLKGNATAAWESTKDMFQDTVSDVKNFIDDKSNTVNKFITENTDQLNVRTDTFKVVKDVYKDYRKQGIDINQFDVENYTSKYGTSEFVDKINSSTMVDADIYPNGVFWTEKEANISYANDANPITISDDRETGNILIKVPVTFEDEAGEKYVVNMYTKDDTFEGMHNNIATGSLARVAAYAWDPFNPVEVTVTHTHPVDGMTDKFSRGAISDETLARLPNVKNVYVADVETGNLYMFDESKPWTSFFKKQRDIDYYNEDYEIDILTEGELPKAKDYIP